MTHHVPFLKPRCNAATVGRLWLCNLHQGHPGDHQCTDQQRGQDPYHMRWSRLSDEQPDRYRQQHGVVADDHLGVVQQPLDHNQGG